MSGPTYHGWTHRPRELGGTDPLPRAAFGWQWGDWIEPELENDWSDVGAPFCAFAYRKLIDEDDVVQAIEWRGHVEGGGNGTVVCTLPSDDRLTCDSLVSSLVEASGGGYQVGRIYFDMTTGEVSVWEDLT